MANCQCRGRFVNRYNEAVGLGTVSSSRCCAIQPCETATAKNARCKRKGGKDVKTERKSEAKDGPKLRGKECESQRPLKRKWKCPVGRSCLVSRVINSRRKSNQQQKWRQIREIVQLAIGGEGAVGQNGEAKKLRPPTRTRR
jgi:hypothetical protein